ncbi:MAG TPA: DegT/DnrJ/EryC1/StrS family aminotransferase [Candidatus Acidoferrum sp.]|nr:DegT/DnrJ/EryC1/StrS family aminotransferase [Candidatus Acidoferrum sp.]
MRVPLSVPDIGQLEIRNVMDVLRSQRLSLGPKVIEFEEKFAEYVGLRYAVAANSGTSALHLAIRAHGIGPDDEVITTPFSFVASTNCILYEGAHPVFIDMDPSTMNMDTRQLERFLEDSCQFDARVGALFNKATGRTIKAILPVHVFGLPCRMDVILNLANKYRLCVIEDACEALGAEFHGRRAGTFGDTAVFGFYPNKQMTTGEGGMLVTNNQEIAISCRSMRNQGRDESSAWLSHVRLGYNYRLSELHSALGLAQLQRLPELLHRRRLVAEVYAKTLSSIPHLILPAEFDGFKRSWFVYVVQLDLPNPKAARDRAIRKLRTNGVECQAYFPSIHKQPHIAAVATIPPGALHNSETASDRSFAIPFFPSATSEQVEYVSETLRRVVSEEAATEQSALIASAR